MFGSIWFCTKSDFWKNYQRSAECFGRPYGFGNGCCCFNFGQITAIHWQECWCSLTVSYYYHFPFLFSFLADQNSSIGDLVTDSLRVLLLLTYKEWPWRLVTFEWWENMTWSTFWQFRYFLQFFIFFTLLKKWNILRICEHFENFGLQFLSIWPFFLWCSGPPPPIALAKGSGVYLWDPMSCAPFLPPPRIFD